MVNHNKKSTNNRGRSSSSITSSSSSSATKTKMKQSPDTLKNTKKKKKEANTGRLRLLQPLQPSNEILSRAQRQTYHEVKDDMKICKEGLNFKYHLLNWIFQIMSNIV